MLEFCKSYARRIWNEPHERTHILTRIKIKQTPKKTFISQTKYTKELIKKFEMEKGKAFETPMSPSTNLDLNSFKKNVDVKMYRGKIGPFLYLTASRPNIMFNVCKCARFQLAPKESHLTDVKRIIYYLIGTQYIGIWYPHSLNIYLIGHSYANFLGDKSDRKSSSGTCQILGDPQSFGTTRNKPQLPNLPPKLNTSLLIIVALRYYGLCINHFFQSFQIFLLLEHVFC